MRLLLLSRTARPARTALGQGQRPDVWGRLGVRQRRELEAPCEGREDVFQVFGKMWFSLCPGV